jgi:hypothetical protein
VLGAGGNGRRTTARAAIVSLLVFAGLTGTAWADFPSDTAPNDPAYRPAEVGNTEQTYPAEPGSSQQTCLQRSADNEQHYLFGFMPQCTKPPPKGIGVPGATDPYGQYEAAGMSVDKAWRQFTAGNSKTVIGYIEAGINWRYGDTPQEITDNAKELANRVFLNAGELPTPTDQDSQPGLDAGDFAVYDGTPTADSNGNGVVDPEDVLVRFSDGVDDDHNGYTDDISGWDFYDNQNDPATVDSSYHHSDNQMRQEAAEANNGVDGAGVCPRCMILPIKAGAEALDRTDDLAQAWLYASDMHADVITSVTADLGYSTFMKQAVDYVWNHGTVMVESSNDFNSTDHQGGMFHSHVLPGNGLVANTHGFPAQLAAEQNALTTTYNSRSGLTSWGTHNMFSASTQGGSTSESTPTVGGAIALVIAYSKEEAEKGHIPAPLSQDEAIQVIRDTADDIDSNPCSPTCWQGRPGFDIQYGYGRINVYRAMKEVYDPETQTSEIPPEAWINSPDWYSVHDPTRESSVPVSGHVAAPRSSVASWKLEFAPGVEPTESQFDSHIAGECTSGCATVDGDLGSINLSQVPQSFWDQAQNPMKMSSTKELETNDQYTVTLRLQVTDAQGRVGEERRAIAVTHDPSEAAGFPKQIGADSQGGEAQPVLADLQGTGKLDIIFGDTDGHIHALQPNGDELPGFPVDTEPMQVTKAHAGVDPGHEPVFSGVAVGDLDHDGRQWIVATSSAGRTYVWDSHGDLRPGWPRVLDTGVTKPPTPRPDRPFTRDAIQGASSSPVLVDMNGDGTLEIVQVAWDGHVHVFRPNGTDLPGWPVEGTLPDPTPPPGYVLINDHKLDSYPAVAQLDNDPEPELLVRSQFSFAPKSCGPDAPPPGCSAIGGPGDVENGGYSNILAYNSDGTMVPGYPVRSEALIFYYGSAQEFITEGVSPPTAADLNGDGQTEWAFSPGIFTPTYMHQPNGTRLAPFGPVPGAAVASLVNGTSPLSLLQSILAGDLGGLGTDAPVAFTTGGAFGRVGSSPTIDYAEPGSGGASVAASLVLAGSGVPISSYMSVHDAGTGAAYPGFPSESQGLDFLGAPAIADVTGDGKPEVIEGGDSSVLHAFASDGTGAQAPGFPKFMSGWVVFGPVTGDIDSDGKVEVIANTREGYLNVWKTDGTTAGNNEWWNGRHDERNTGEYGVDTRPPGILRDASVSADASRLDFTAPGDDWYADTADHYAIATSDSPITPDNFDGATPLSGAPAPAESGTAQSFTVPAEAKRYVAIRAVDDAGNLGPVHDFDRGAGAGGGTGGDGTGGTGGTGGSGGGSGGVAGTTGGGPTGKRAAALKKCKKKHSKQARRKCRKRAKHLPL